MACIAAHCTRFSSNRSLPPAFLHSPSTVSLPTTRALSTKVYASASGGNEAAQTVASAREFEGEILSGEWPENFSMLNFEDLCKHYEPIIFKEDAQPQMLLASVMSMKIFTARADQLLEEVDHFFQSISGLPVINKDLKCIGVLSKKDRAKASKGLNSTVGEVMSSPAITLSVDKTVNDAAVLMLKNKIHRLPVINEVNQVVGIVTRTDIFKALEAEA
ncbi:hypothetical protein GOP47_0028388 [Adiantum capillus-veneris]|nr:hypothetical protein GOP47_0028388 [Adiantum capillus-veneris]